MFDQAKPKWFNLSRIVPDFKPSSYLVKNSRPKHKAIGKDGVNNPLKGASFLEDKELYNQINQLIDKKDDLHLELHPYTMTSDMMDNLFMEGIDFVLIDFRQLPAYQEIVSKTAVKGLPVVLLMDVADDLGPEDISYDRIIDVIDRHSLTRHTLLKTQLLLHSNLKTNRISFLDNLNRDSFFESLLGKLEDPVSITDENNRYIWINQAYEDLLGYSLKELSGKTPVMVMDQDDLNQIMQGLGEEGGSYRGNHRAWSKNGSAIDLNMSFFRLKDKNTGLMRIASIHRTIKKGSQKENTGIDSEEKFQKFINSIDDLVTIIETNGKISYASPGFNKSLGYHEGELQQTLIFEYIDSRDLRTLRGVLKKGSKNSIKPVRFRFRKKNGEYIWLEARGGALHGVNQKVTGFVLGASVIHDRILSEEKLKQTESRYRILVEHVYDLVLEIDANAVITEIAGNSKEALRKSSASLIGRKLTHSVYREDIRLLERCLKNDLNGCEVRFKTGEGNVSWFEVSAHSFRGSQNDARQLIILKNIHEKKKILKKIREGESLYDLLTENIQDVIIRTDRTLNIVYANTVAKVELFENQPVKNIMDLKITPEVRNRLLKSIDKVNHSLKPDQFEIKIGRQEKAAYYNWTIIPEYSDHSEFFSYLIMARNVTPFMVARHEVSRLYGILEKSTNSILITDRDGNIEYVNPAVEQVSGYTQDELMGKNPKIFKSGHTDPSTYDALWETISSGEVWNGVLCNKKKNGDLFWENVIISPIKNFDGHIIKYLAVKDDITYQRAIEQELQSVREKLNLTLEAAQVGTWVVNIPDKKILWDDQVVKLCGYSLEEIGNGDLSLIKNLIHPDDLENVIEVYNKGLETQEVLDLEFRLITKLGLTKNVFIKGQIIRDAQGNPQRMDGISMDITGQKAIEENLKLRNEELNQFVYKVSHDLRAPLASIRGIIELEKLQNKNKSQFKYVNLIEDRISNLDQFMRNILSHSRNLNTSVKYKQIDFQRITDDCFKELEFLRNALSIKRIVRISKFQFYSDESRMFEIFRNLISNSIKYIDYDKTEPFIKITVKKEGSIAVIVFEDNGVGIDAELQNNIFDMFYRANEKSDGSGIGLYIVKQAVEKLNGSIEVKSRKGEGTRFRVIIPNTKTKVTADSSSI